MPDPIIVNSSIDDCGRGYSVQALRTDPGEEPRAVLQVDGGEPLFLTVEDVMRLTYCLTECLTRRDRTVGDIETTEHEVAS